MLGRAVWIILAIIFSSSEAQALRLSILGGLSHTTPQYSSQLSGFAIADNTQGKIGLGAGLAIGFGLLGKIDFEVGAFYLQRKYDDNLTINGSTERITLTDPVLRVPLIFRIWLSPFLTIGGGAYASTGVRRASWTGSAGSGKNTYGELGLKNLDYGVLGIFGFNFPFKEGKSTAVVIEAQYYFGMGDTAVAATHKRVTREFVALVGIRFGARTD